VRCVRLYRQLAQIQRCLRLLVGIQVPPSRRFSRLQEEQNFRLWEVSWVAAGVEVVMGNPGKPNLNRSSILPVLSRWGWAEHNSDRISRLIAIKIEPSLIFKVIELAFAGSVEIPSPGELLDKNTLWKDGF